MLTIWRAKRVIGRVEGYDGYTKVIHSVVGRAIMVELLLIFVAKHGKDKHTIEVTETPALLRPL